MNRSEGCLFKRRLLTLVFLSSLLQIEMSVVMEVQRQTMLMKPIAMEMMEHEIRKQIPGVVEGGGGNHRTNLLHVPRLFGLLSGSVCVKELSI